MFVELFVKDKESGWHQHMDPIWFLYRLCRWMQRWHWKESTTIASIYRQWFGGGFEGWVDEVQVGSQTGFGVGLMGTSDMGLEFEGQNWRVD